jgi:hypothetical protein
MMNSEQEIESAATNGPRVARGAQWLLQGLGVAVLYAVCLFFIGMIQDRALQPDWLIRLPEFLKFDVAAQDPHTFAGAAMEVSREGWLTPASIWIFRLWPPGFILLESAVFRVLGPDAPFLAALLGLSILAGTLMLMTVREYLRAYVSPLWAVFLPLLPFAFPVTRFTLLQSLGLSFGEGFSVMFFVTGIFVLLLASRGNSLLKGVGAGTLLALSAYFRSQYEVLVMSMSVLAVLMAVFIALKNKRKSAKGEKLRSTQFGIFVIIASVLAAQLLMFPWRLNNFRDVGKWNWVHTQDLVARNSLTSEQKLLEGGGGFVIQGGGHLACLFEPTYCGKDDHSLFYKAFLKNLPQWYSYKISILDEFWFPSIESFPKIVKHGASPAYFGNSLVLIFMIAILFFLYLIRRLQIFWTYVWILVSFYGCFFVVLSLVQFESRYFFLIKIFALFIFIAMGSLAWSHRRDNARLLSNA